MRAMRILAAVMSLLIGSSPVIEAAGVTKDLGSFGRVYEIAEPDMLEEIRARAAQVDWQKHLDPARMKAQVQDFQPPDLQRLPKATRTQSFLVDPTYVLEMDIPDPRDPSGRSILYPKGFAFNPLDYRPMPSILVILDGSDPEQIAWFESTPYREDLRTKLLLCDGNYFALMERLNRPVYYLIAPHAKRLQLRAVPSVVVQRGQTLEVTEFLVGKEKAP